MVTNQRQKQQKQKQSIFSTTQEMEDWVQCILERDWEVFWDKDGYWYDAKIVKRTGELQFEVVFVGDEATYVMNLKPAHVRPSARAWIHFAKTLLTQEMPSDFQGWHTGYWKDERHLVSIREQTAKEFPVFKPASYEHEAQESSELEVLCKEHGQCCELLTRVRILLYLQTRLSWLEDESDNEEDSEGESNGDDQSDGEESNDDDPEDEPSLAYLEYLAGCLTKLEKACIWHFHTWGILRRMFSIQQDDPPEPKPKSREELIDKSLLDGRNSLVDMLSITDISKSASKLALSRKRRGGVVSYTRPTKRRKTTNWFIDRWLHPNNESEEGAMKLEQEEYDALLSSSIVAEFVDRTNTVDERWFTSCFGRMLRFFSKTVVAPYMTWEQSVRLALGESDLVEPHTSREEAENICFVTYEQVEDLIESANHDRVLKSVVLSQYVTRLGEKLSAIDAFETRAWEHIARVLDDDGLDSVDSIKGDLQTLLLEANAQNGPIENVDPIGHRSSPLTRSVVENAVLYREWYLDLKHAERNRERLAFVEDVVSRFSKLPSLPSRNGTRNLRATGINGKLNKIAPRVRSLSSVCLDNVALFSRFHAMVSDRALPLNNDDRESLMTIDGALAALNELRQVNVICPAEEMLAVRIDTLRWDQASLSIMKDENPTFTAVERLKEDADKILQYQSPMILNAVKGLRLSTVVAEEIKAFAKADLETICGQTLSRVQSLFEGAASWSGRAQVILEAVSTGSEPGDSAANQISISELNAVIDMYSQINVDHSDVQMQLSSIRENCLTWSTAQSSCLLDESLDFEELLSTIRTGERTRPVGVEIEPNFQISRSLVELLEWYSSIKKFLASKVSDKDLLHTLLLVGEDIVILFGVKVSGHEPNRVFREVMKKMRSIPNTQRIPLSLLKSSPLSNAVLERLTDVSRDTREGSPLLFFLYGFWAFAVDYFVGLCEDATADRSDVTIDRAVSLLEARPSFLDSIEISERWDFLRTKQFTALTEEGVRLQSKIQDALSVPITASLPYVQLQSLKSHQELLEKLWSELSTVQTTPGKFKMHPAHETALRKKLVVADWMTRAFASPILSRFLTRQEEVDLKPGDRIPWDTLAFLQKNIPEEILACSQVDPLLNHIESLYTSATEWKSVVASIDMAQRGAPIAPSEAHQAAKSKDSNARTLDVERLRKVVDDPILAKVDMTEAQIVLPTFQATLEFETSIEGIFGIEYLGESPDRGAIPVEKSLIGQDGSFLLYRLTGNPVFGHLKKTISSTLALLPRLPFDTPGKATIQWLRRVCSWIDAVLASTTPQSVLWTSQMSISKDIADKLLSQGDELFLDLPLKVKKTLGLHKISINVNASGRLRVLSKKGGSQHSAGAVIVRWCPFLHNALRNDIDAVERWTASVEVVSREIVAAQQQGGEASYLSDEVATHLLSCRDDVFQLLDDGSELVVSPNSLIVQHLRTVLRNIDGRLSAVEGSRMLRIAKQFRDSRYKDRMVTTRDRFLLLDALLGRKELCRAKIKESIDFSKKPGLDLRTAGRTLFASALRKSALTINMEDDVDLDALCAIKAWEIESALNEVLEEESGEANISQKYQGKARALKRSIEDPENLAMAIKILIGEIGTEELVRMSLDQLANPNLRKDRESAARTASHNTILAEPSRLFNSSAIPKPVESMQVGVKIETADMDRKPVAKQAAQNLEVQRSPGTKHEGSRPLSLGLEGVSPTAENQVAKQKSPSSLKKTFKLGDFAKQRAPPPPPPSLVASLQPQPAVRGPLSAEDVVTNADGGDQFHLIVGEHPNKEFYVHLFAEQDAEKEADGMLPERIKQEGRTSSNNLTAFLEQKRHWQTLVLRVATVGATDAHAYKEHYKEYEREKRRVSMFKFGEGKGFLITPRFHKYVAGVKFMRETSAYLVILKRKNT